MIIFLTGDRGIGKSTVIAKTLYILNKNKAYSIGGYKTKLIEDSVFMFSADETSNEKLEIGKKGIGGYTEIFDGKCIELIEKSLSKKDLILMDEIGWMEKDALKFQSYLESILSEGYSILGVVRKDCSTHIIDKIKSSYADVIIEVTKENRDTLPDKIAKMFSE